MGPPTEPHISSSSAAIWLLLRPLFQLDLPWLTVIFVLVMSPVLSLWNFKSRHLVNSGRDSQYLRPRLEWELQTGQNQFPEHGDCWRQPHQQCTHFINVDMYGGSWACVISDLRWGFNAHSLFRISINARPSALKGYIYGTVTVWSILYFQNSMLKTSKLFSDQSSQFLFSTSEKKHRE